MKNIAVFVSGSGSDMQSVIDACEAGEIDGKVVAVIASRPGIFALERAAKHGIESRVFSVKDFSSAQEKDAAIVKYLADKDIDLIVLAGYLSIVTKPLLLMADEPTGSLDSHKSVEIMELLTDLNKSDKITIVLVTHEPDMARYARRCVHCIDGMIASDVLQEGL